MKRIKHFFFFIYLTLIFYSAFSQDEKISASNLVSIQKNLQSLPVIVRENKGQWDDRVLYRGASPKGAAISFLKNGLSFAFTREKKMKEDPLKAQYIALSNQQCLVWNLIFEDINPDVNIVSSGNAESHTNYFIGDKTIINAPDHEKLTYKNIYNNIDLNYYSEGQNVKYDYVIHRGASASSVKMKCEGISLLKINIKGELEIETAWGVIAESKPYSYQLSDGEKKEIDVRFFLYNDSTYGFKVYGEYDPDKDLVIDPILLAWSTYVDGTLNTTNGYQYDITVDTAGNVYATGQNNDSYPVTAGVYDNTYNGDGGNALAICSMGDVFVYKMNPTGTTLLWATYVGGSGDEQGRGIKVNATGDVFVCGMTNSTNFPVSATAYKKIFSLGSQQTDGFVFKLTNNASILSYSTYLGGDNGDEFLYDLSLGANGEAIITGTSSASNYPTTLGVYQTINSGGDAVVTRMNSTGSGLIYSTFVGNGGLTGLAMDLDAAENVYVIGTTYSTLFPTSVGAFQPAMGGGSIDGLVFKLSSNATSLIYGSYIGGSGNEFIAAGIGASYFSYGFGISVNSSGEAFVTGATGSTNFPITAGAYSTSLKGGSNYDVFVSRINAAGTALIYSTYFGSNSVDVGFDIKVNSKNEAFVVGTTNGGSGTFPLTVCTYDSIYGVSGFGGGGSDIFVAKFNPTGTKLMFSSFYGGSDWDYSDPSIELITAGCSNEAMVGFTTHSYDLPKTTGAYKKNITNTLYANDHPALFKLKPKSNPPTFIYTTPACNTPVTFTANIKCGLWDSLTYHWDFGDGGVDSGQVATHTFLSGGSFNVKLNIECPNDSVTKTVVVPSSFTFTTTATPVNCITTNSGSASVTVAGGTGVYSYTWSNGATTQTTTGLVTGNYSVTVSDGGSCQSTTVINIAQPPVLSNPPPTITDVKCNGNSDGLVYVSPSGGTSPYSYVWSNGSTAQTAVNLIAGIYTVTVNDAGSCVSSTTVVVSEPIQITLTTSSTDATCGQADGSADVSAIGGTGAYIYLWSNGATTLSINNITPTIYSVTVTDANACTKTISVLVNNNTAFTASAGPDKSICKGDTVQLNAVGGGTYLWSSATSLSNASINDPNAFPVITTSYIVTVTLGTCSGQDTVKVTVNTPPIANAGLDQTIFTGQSVTLNASGGISYLWVPPTGLSTTVSANPIAAPTATTTYTVFVSDANGCISTDIVTLFIDDSSCNGDAIFIPKAFSPNNDGENDVLYIRGFCIKELFFSVFDRWGEKVFETTDVTHGWDGTFRNQKMNTGVYVYDIIVTLYNDVIAKKKGSVTLLR